VSNIRQCTQSINEQCPIYGNDCTIIGNGTPAQAAASGPHGGLTGGGGIFGMGGGAGPTTPGSGGSGAGSACSTTSTLPSGLPVGLGAAAGLLGLVGLRMRRSSAGGARRR
jgi:hypothetical protein